MKKDSKIYIAGHAGLVGSAINRHLIKKGYNNIITRTSGELDIRDGESVKDFFYKEKPEYVFLCAAKVGGVMALDKYRAESIYCNLAIQNNVIHNAYLSGVKKLMFFGSNCLFPKNAEQPIKEDSILSGKLDTSTEAYAMAKLAGIMMCQAYQRQYGCNFITVLPVNMYGENDGYDLEKSHVMPALLKKFHTAIKENKPNVEIWGSGNAMREFMHSDDLADACLFLMLNYNESEPINVGTGRDISIRGLAELIKEITGYTGELVFDTSRPEGIKRKLLDNSKLNALGWKPTIELRQGIKRIYDTLK